jgi:hypothetical protein
MANAHWQIAQQREGDPPLKKVSWNGTFNINSQIESQWNHLTKE